MIFFTVRWESCAGIRTRVRWRSRVDGKDGFSERGVTCYPREINVFVAGKRKTARGRKERGLRSKTKACWYNEDSLDLYPIKVSSLKAKSFPNNGVIARRRPLPGNSVRYVRRWPLTAASAPPVAAQIKATMASQAPGRRRRRNKEET